jgi:hypothetical protein
MSAIACMHSATMAFADSMPTETRMAEDGMHGFHTHQAVPCPAAHWNRMLLGRACFETS